jgi:hypothetical protein
VVKYLSGLSRYGYCLVDDIKLTNRLMKRISRVSCGLERLL